MAGSGRVSSDEFLAGVRDARNSQEQKRLRESRSHQGEFGEFHPFLRVRDVETKRAIRMR